MRFFDRPEQSQAGVSGIPCGIQVFYQHGDLVLSCQGIQHWTYISKLYFANKQGIAAKDIYSVAIMPCTAKKYEVSRQEMVNDVDAVLTTREF